MTETSFKCVRIWKRLTYMKYESFIHIKKGSSLQICAFWAPCFYFFFKELAQKPWFQRILFQWSKRKAVLPLISHDLSHYSKWYETWGLVHPAPSSSDGAQAYMAVVDATEAESIRLGDDYKLRGRSIQAKGGWTEAGDNLESLRRKCRW